LRLQWDCLNYRTDPRAWLQIAADLIRAARVGLDVLGLVAEPGEGVAQVVEPPELLVDIGEACVEEVADVTAWGFGLVTLSDVPSVSDLLYAHYPDACSRCGQNPCLIYGHCPPL